MNAIIIKADKENSKLIKEIAKKLGATVTDVKSEQYEDFVLGSIMDQEKTGKTVNRNAIIKKLRKK